MISKEQARKIAIDYLSKSFQGSDEIYDDDEPFILEDDITEEANVWVVKYDSKKWLETHDPKYALLVKIPLTINKLDGSIGWHNWNPVGGKAAYSITTTRTVSLKYGRIMYGDVKNRWKYTPERIITKQVQRDNAINTPNNSIYLQLRFQREHDKSGILGVSYTHNAGEYLKIEVGVLNSEKDPVKAIKGIPDKFANHILDETLITLNEVDFIGSGTLLFTTFAWLENETDEKIVRLLTRSVLELLNPELENISGKKAKTLIDNIRKDVGTRLYEEQTKKDTQ